MKIPNEFYQLAKFFLPEIYNINESFEEVLDQLYNSFTVYNVDKKALCLYLDFVTTSSMTDKELATLWMSAKPGILTTNGDEVRKLFIDISQRFKI